MEISIVIPTYKRPDMLDRVLESITTQTLYPDEVIVVDDASNMENEYNSVIEKHKLKLRNLTFLSHKQNTGAPSARNTGIDYAKGKWIALVDDDDEWLPQKLEKQFQIISKADDRIGLIYSWCDAVGSNGLKSYHSTPNYRGDFRKAILTNNFILSPTVIAKKEALTKVAGFDTSLPSCQDWDTWIKIALAGFHTDYVPEVLALYHRHGGESIGLSKTAKIGYRRLLEKHKYPILRQTTPINWLRKLKTYIDSLH